MRPAVRAAGARDRSRGWIAVRATVALAAFGAAFVDGLGFFLSPGQAVVWALGSAVPQPPDTRWGIFLGLVLYAALAFVSVIIRAKADDEAAPATLPVAVRRDTGLAA